MAFRKDMSAASFSSCRTFRDFETRIGLTAIEAGPGVDQQTCDTSLIIRGGHDHAGQTQGRALEGADAGRADSHVGGSDRSTHIGIDEETDPARQTRPDCLEISCVRRERDCYLDLVGKFVGNRIKDPKREAPWIGRPERDQNIAHCPIAASVDCRIAMLQDVGADQGVFGTRQYQRVAADKIPVVGRVRSGRVNDDIAAMWASGLVVERDNASGEIPAVGLEQFITRIIVDN